MPWRTLCVWFTATCTQMPPRRAFQRDNLVSEIGALVEAGQESRKATTILSFSGQECSFG